MSDPKKWCGWLPTDEQWLRWVRETTEALKKNPPTMTEEEMEEFRVWDRACAADGLEDE